MNTRQKPHKFVRVVTKLSQNKYNGEWIELLQSAGSYSRKNWEKHCLQPGICCFAGRKFIHRNYCLQGPNIKKTDKFFYRQQGHVPIFLFPSELTKLYVDSWLISGPLGQTLCKLVFFLGFISIQVSIQSLVLIAVDRFGADGISPPFSTHQFKTVPLLHSRHMDRRYGSHVAIFVRLQTY